MSVLEVITDTGALKVGFLEKENVSVYPTPTTFYELAALPQWLHESVCCIRVMSLSAV